MAFMGGNGGVTVINGVVTPPPPPPTPTTSLLDIATIDGEEGSTICVPVTVTDFTDIASLQFSLEWDPAVLEYVELANADALGITGGNVNDMDKDNGSLTVAWTDPNAAGVTLADGTTIFEMCFIVRGAVGTSGTISFSDNPTPQLFSNATEEMAFMGGNGGITVIDGVVTPPPTPTTTLLDIATIDGEEGSTVCIPVTVTDFTDIASLQFSLEWDPAVLEYVELANTDALGITGGNVNDMNKDNGSLTIAWTDPNAAGVTLADGTTIFEMCFIVRGAVGTSGTISFSDNPTPQLFSNANDEMPFAGGNGSIAIVEGNTSNCGGAITVVATPTNVSCNGLSDGTISLNVSGGDGLYTYQWSDPSIGNTPNATGLVAGVYNVTITSCGGSEIRNNIPPASLTVTEPTAIVSVITPVDVSCFGAADGLINVSVSGGFAPYDFAWSDPILFPTNRPTNASAAITYNLTITDASNCTNSMTGIVLSGPTQIAATVSTTQASCTGIADGTATITASGGSGSGYTFNWGVTGISGPTPTNVPGGNYTVTITDDTQCSTTIPVTITEATALSTTVQVVDDDCGDNSGAIQVTLTGATVPITYDWNGPVTIGNTNTAENLPTGIYTLTITEGTGCSLVELIQVGGPTAVLSANGTVSDVSCTGDDNGMINLSVAGGFEPYTFNWTNGATTQNINNLTAGGYTVTVTDSKVCTFTQNFIVGVRSNPEVSIEVTNGAPNGEATATATGGVAPYRYEWCNGQVGPDVTGLDEGICSLTVIDALGCTIVENVEIIVDNPVASIAAVAAISCEGSEDGSLQVSATGGRPDYTYEWSTGATTSIITDIGAGNYSATVTDAGGNESIVSFDLAGPSALLIELSEPIIPSCNNDGQICINVSGGTPPYKEIRWSNDIIDELCISGLRAGEFGVIVTDDNDCTAEANFRVLNDETCVPCFMSNKVMTPNDDGRNDAFCISCVDLATNNHVEVYNRWGQLVFETDDYECVLGTESDCWKGLTRANNLVDEGGYFWVLEFDDGGERRQIRDYVTILRDN